LETGFDVKIEKRPGQKREEEVNQQTVGGEEMSTSGGETANDARKEPDENVVGKRAWCWKIGGEGRTKQT